MRCLSHGRIGEKDSSDRPDRNFTFEGLHFFLPKIICLIYCPYISEQDAPPKKKKKKDKTPQLNGFHQEEDEEAEPEPAKTEKSKKKLKKQKEHIENPAKKAQKLKKLNKKKQKVEAEELSADEDGEEVVVLNAQSEDGGTKTEVRDTSATSPNSMAAIRRAILEMQKGKKGLEQPLFAGGFEDSDDEANIINDSIDTTPKSKKKKKGKKAKKAQETDEGAEGEDFESLEDSVVERLSGGESPENGSAKKKKKKQRKLSIASADAEEIIQTATPTSAKSKKKAKAVQNGAEELEEEIEVFVPNKKYKGALKEGFEREMKKSLGKTEASFASFETGAKTPVAFVRRAMSKLKTPKSEPRKSRKQVRNEFFLGFLQVLIVYRRCRLDVGENRLISRSGECQGI